MPKHIVRLIVLIVAFGAAALLAKSYFTVESFYQYGHYRADSVPEIAAQEPVYQTPALLPGLPCRAPRAVVGQQPQDGDLRGLPRRGARATRRTASCRFPTDTREAVHAVPRSDAGTAAHAAADRRRAARARPAVHRLPQPACAEDLAAAAKVTGDAAAGGEARGRAAPAATARNGISPNDTWPNLAGQHAAYLARILGAYKSGAQKDVAMTPLAQGLSDADVQNLAAYFGGLSCTAAPAASARRQMPRPARPWPRIARPAMARPASRRIPPGRSSPARSPATS